MDSCETYLVTQPGFFAAYLVKTLRRAGLQILRLNERIDYEYVRKRAPQVIFWDPDYESAATADSVRKLRRCSPQSTICLYTSHVETEWARSCFTAGANAVLTKYASDTEIVAGIRVALRIGTYADYRIGDLPVTSA